MPYSVLTNTAAWTQEQKDRYAAEHAARSTSAMFERVMERASASLPPAISEVSRRLRLAQERAE